MCAREGDKYIERQTLCVCASVCASMFVCALGVCASMCMYACVRVHECMSLCICRTVHLCVYVYLMIPAIQYSLQIVGKVYKATILYVTLCVCARIHICVRFLAKNCLLYSFISVHIVFHFLSKQI